jgi:hypothetical protein
MSAKGRKPKTADTGSEFYPTEPWVVEALLESPLVALPGGRWIEPCAGTGSIVRASRASRRDVTWHMHEIDPHFTDHLIAVGDVGDRMVIGDFVSYDWQHPIADVAIMNPPFTLTMQFVRACMERARTVVMLQRVGWFGTPTRAPWLREHCPDVYTLPKRPSFTPDGKTDMSEYAWFVWPEGERERRVGVVAMLDMPTGGQLEIGGAA